MVDQTAPIPTRCAVPRATGGRAAIPAASPTGPDLGQLEHHLERLNRLASMGAVTGMIAHEFNNILTPILSYAQMALEDPGNAALSTKALERTVAGAERAAKIAEAILNFVRDDASTAPASHCNVRRVVEESSACLARRSTDEGGRLAINVPASLTAAIDGVRLQQVLVNLLLNARAAMGERELDMSIEAVELAEAPLSPPNAADSRKCSTWNAQPSSQLAGAWIGIRVKDRGPGMSATQLASLFTPFCSNSDPAHHRGTGLGMTVSRRLVEGAGGWLVVESARGVGTTVHIIVPAAHLNT